MSEWAIGVAPLRIGSTLLVASAILVLLGMAGVRACKCQYAHLQAR